MLFQLIGLSTVLCFASNVAASSSSSTIAAAPKPATIAYNLKATQQIYIHYFTGLIPFYKNAQVDSLLKLTQLDGMDGLQQFLSYSSLLTQLIPAHTDCKRLTDVALKNVGGLPIATGSDPTITYTPVGYDVIGTGFQNISQGDEMSAKGIVKAMNGIEDAITDPSYSVSGNILTISYSSALKIYKGLSTMSGGSLLLASALQSVLDLNIEKVLSIQDNIDACNFLTPLFTMFSKNQNSFDKIGRAGNKMAHLFDFATTTPNGPPKTVNINLTVLYQSMKKATKAIAASFGTLYNTGETFRLSVEYNEPPPSSSTILM